MQGFNAILVYDASGEQILFCHRTKEPYKGKYNFVGGKIEEKENGFAAAYRELFEETGITKEDIELHHLMDLTYHARQFYLEIYVGRLKKDIELVAEKHPLIWLNQSEDFFDTDKFAGHGNIGHIIRIVQGYGFGVKEIKQDYLQIRNKFIGIDGCKGGWIAAILDKHGLKMEKHQILENLVMTHPDFSECLIDMVIGLQEKKEEIRPDSYARKIISKRASTIFPAPCRQAIYADTVAEKYDLNQKILGKKFTPLTLGIMPKMREVDEFLEKYPNYKNVLKESHPEVCFSRLLGETIMTKKNSVEGIEERIKILSRFVPIDREYLLAKEKEFKCSMDDLLDAICLAVAGVLVQDGKCERVPEEPMRDARGLLMQMIIPRL